MPQHPNAVNSHDGRPVTLPALRVEVERLREQIEGLRAVQATEEERVRGGSDTESAVRKSLARERDLERERRKVAEEEVRRLRERLRTVEEEREARIRAEERAKSVDTAAGAVEKNLNAVLDRRERAIAEKDRVIASLARALGGAERERDMLQRPLPAARRPWLLVRWFSPRRRSGRRTPAPAPPPPPPPERALEVTSESAPTPAVPKSNDSPSV